MSGVALRTSCAVLREFVFAHMLRHICDFIIDCKLEQRANIKLCIKFGKSATETFDMIRHVYGYEATTRARCFEWHARFKSGRTSLDDKKEGRKCFI